MSSPLTFTHISASFRPHFFSLCHQLVDFTFQTNIQSHFSFLSPYLPVSSSRYFTLPSSHIRTLFSLHFSLYVSLYSETSFLLSSRYGYSFFFSIFLSLLICFSASSLFVRLFSVHLHFVFIWIFTPFAPSSLLLFSLCILVVFHSAFSSFLCFYFRYISSFFVTVFNLISRKCWVAIFFVVHFSLSSFLLSSVRIFLSLFS